jgi:hypothetical protein
MRLLGIAMRAAHDDPSAAGTVPRWIHDETD